MNGAGDTIKPITRSILTGQESATPSRMVQVLSTREATGWKSGARGLPVCEVGSQHAPQPRKHRTNLTLPGMETAWVMAFFLKHSRWFVQRGLSFSRTCLCLPTAHAGVPCEPLGGLTTEEPRAFSAPQAANRSTCLLSSWLSHLCAFAMRLHLDTCSSCPLSAHRPGLVSIWSPGLHAIPYPE